MADITTFKKYAIYRIGTGVGVPTVASGVTASDTTITSTVPFVDENGTAIAVDMLVTALLKVGDNKGQVEVFKVPAGGVSSDGLTFTGCIRGIEPGGLDEAGNPDFALSLPEGTILGIAVTSLQLTAICDALLGTLGSTYKLNARPTYTGTNAIHSDRVFADATARDAAITAPTNGDRCYNTGTGTFQKYQGGAWADDATGTTANASTTVAGKVEESTAAQSIAGTDTGETGARTFVVPSQIAKNTQNQAHVYAASSAGSDTYVVTLAVAPAAYAAGQKFVFKADVANTGTATVNFNTLGALTIKRPNGNTLETNDIRANQFVEVEVIDSSNCMMVSQLGNASAEFISTVRTFGENINGTTTPQAVYMSDGTGGRTSGRVYLSDANDSSNEARQFIGFAKENITSGNTGSVYSGIVGGFSGLTVDAFYFVTDTAGSISATAGAAEIPVGQAISTTEIDTRLRPTSMMFISTVNASGVTTGSTITAPAIARIALIKITTPITGAGKEEKGEIMLTKVGKTDGVFQGVGNTNVEVSVSASWSGNTITLTSTSDGSGANMADTAVAYFYR